MLEVVRNDKSYASIEDTGIPIVSPYNKRGAVTVDTNILLSKFPGDLSLLSYKQTTLQPCVGSHIMAQRAAQVLEKMLPQNGVVVDIGTGTGLIALTIQQQLKAREDITVVGTDISAEALVVAELNAKLNDLPQVKWRQRDGVDLRIREEFGKVDCIISNPPFYSEEDLPNNLRRCTFTPHKAVVAEQGGFAFYQKLLEGSREILADTGFVVLQVPGAKIEVVAQMAAHFLPGREMIVLSGKRVTGKPMMLVIGPEGITDVFRTKFPETIREVELQ